MDLEQRVQILEQELQILKGQIQATLLEMQEYLLTNAHPILRAEETLQPEKAVTPTPEVTPKHIKAGLEVFEEDEEEEEAPSPVVKRVKLEDVKPPSKNEPSVRSRNGTAKMSAHVEEVDDDDEDDVRPHSRRATSADRQPKSRNASPRQSAYIEEVEDDEADSYAPPIVRRVSLNDSYADNQATQPSRRAMNQSHYDKPEQEDDEDQGYQVPRSSNGRRANSESNAKATIPAYEPVQEETPPATPDIPGIVPSSSSEWTALNRLAEWVGDKVKNLGPQRTRELIEKNAKKGNFSVEVKDALLQLLGLYDEDGSLNSHRLDTVLDELSEPNSTGPYEVISQEESQDANQQLILRLIAGVRNAGASSARRKKNG